MSAAEAAFTQTLKSEKIVELLSLTATHEDDIVYKMFQARMAVCKSLYGYTNTMEKQQIELLFKKLQMFTIRLKSCVILHLYGCGSRYVLDLPQWS